jgi:hypothetical protein
MRNFVAATVLLIVCGQSHAEEQPARPYIPLEIQSAYANKTRSPDGRPGPRYWQNRAVYTIAAEIVPAARSSLAGTADIKYFNNSPSSLDKLVIRLYPDYYKTGNARDWDLPAEDIGAGTVISFVSIDGVDLTHAVPTWTRSTTNLTVPLASKLPPGGSLSLRIKWSYTFATASSFREGQYPNNAYFAGYWYPQVAVFDDLSGWDELEWKGVIDFYNDFSDFDVSIRAPREYVVWATGTLQNPEEVLAPEYLRRYQAARQSDQVLSIVSAEDRRAGGVTPNRETITWRYQAREVPDFAFAASKHHLWDGVSLPVDEQPGRRVLVSVAYTSQAQFLHKAASLTRRTLDFLSHELPGVAYPFPAFTVFEGSGACEFPMMTNIGEYKNREWLNIHTLSHEITHSYFPFYMGFNERKYASMDEGLTQMVPMEFQTREISQVRPGYDARLKNNRDYEESAGRELQDHPPAVPSVNMHLGSWHNVNYDRPGAAYLYLQDLLGRERFAGALREFMRRWHHKHPTLYDFFNSLQDAAGEDLTWYLKPWFFEFGYPDLALNNVSDAGGTRVVVVERRGLIPIPVKLTLTYEDGSVETVYRTVAIWRSGDKTFSWPLERPGRLVRVELGDKTIPDVERGDNTWERRP